MKYLPRIIDEELLFRLETFGGVLIEGPKWCGKTTTASVHSKSIISLQDPDHREEYLQTIQIQPSLILEGEYPRLFDEWQEAPVLWDAIRTSIDRKQEEGLYILTGSNSVDEKAIQHSGTGRISRLVMEPMSLYETNESNGTISLQELFENPNCNIDNKKSQLTIEQLIYAACRGGWPASLRKKSQKAQLFVAKDYVDQICSTDISRVDGVSRDAHLTREILRSYARNISTLVKNRNIMRDVRANFENLSQGRYDAYINALQRLFVIKDIDAWCPSIRSATVIRAGKKRQLVDPSIAVASLGVSPNYFKTDLKTFGFIFECLCFRDLRVYSQSLGGRLSYYNDRYGLEADAVLHLDDGRYALIEFKLGSKEIDEGAKHLLKLKTLIQEHNKEEKQVPLREPDLLMIITGGQFAYTREDGVKVIPIGCLKD